MAIYGGSVRDSFNAAAGGYKATLPPEKVRAATVRTLFDLVERNTAGALGVLLAENPGAADWRNDAGETPLMAAARAGSVEAGRKLLQAGADIEAENANGSTALMFAAFSGKAIFAQLLLESGADPNHINHKGHTPLMSASGQGFKNTIKVLLDAKADPRPASQDGDTALSYAQEAGDSEIIGMLVRAKQLAEESGRKIPAPANQPANQNEFNGVAAVKKPPTLGEAEQAAREAAEKRASRDENTNALRDLEKRMRNAGLF
jgi:hypothetical protein